MIDKIRVIKEKNDDTRSRKLRGIRYRAIRDEFSTEGIPCEETERIVFETTITTTTE